jgi:antitoxin ParD1/3/4
MDITLPADLENYVQSLVVSGCYSDPDAVVGKALAMLKRHEELRREIQIGIDQLDRGEYVEYDESLFQRFMDDIKVTEATIFLQESR